jgi:radical SAM superfamily enzyme YgiQ (UPF0313 family)
LVKIIIYRGKIVMKKIALISPQAKDGHGHNEGHSFFPPVGLGIIASLIPEDKYEVTIIDEAIETIDFSSKFDLVGISIVASNSIRGYELAQEFRKRNIPVVIGGIHATLMTEEALEYADAVCIGEAEGHWHLLLEDFENGSLKRIYRNENPPPICQKLLCKK